jgi:SAM-dependent MidA family methyltransferase
VSPLEQAIIEKIRAEGAISFRTFMEMALYYPELGYYSSGRAIGKSGDFYTSPHLHSIFGAMIALQLQEMWEYLGRPSDFYAIEQGAGAGHLCKDIIEFAGKLNLPFRDCMRYVIVEPFTPYRELQEKTLGDLIGRVRRVESLNELEQVTGCIFSNELIDAFPVHLVEIDEEPFEIYINHDGQTFHEEKGHLSSGELKDVLNTVKLPAGKIRTEINLEVGRWLKQCGGPLARGFLLTIDYGYTEREYFSEERSRGTIMCYRNHQYNENPLDHIGDQDITAHVNFTHMMRWGEDAGFKTLGYCSQGTYLISLGIDEVITELYGDSPGYLSEVSRIKGLIFPQGMGASHQVMIQYKGDGSPSLRGFAMRNLIDSL